MFERDKLLHVNDSIKSNVAKYGLVFAGGLIVGFGIKTLIDNGVLDDVKNATPANVYDEEEEKEEEKEKAYEEITIE